MKKFIRGTLSRLLSVILMVLFMLPSLIMPLTTRGNAAEGGRINILFMPLELANPDAPQNLSARILQELQIALAQREGVQVTALEENSPIMKRALATALEKDKTSLLDKFHDAANMKLSSDTRKNAAGNLVRVLGVDAVVFGTINNYEFTTKPDDKNRTYIKVTISKVTLAEDGTAVLTPLEAVGASWVRPDGKGEQATHDQEAIQALAQDLAVKLTGGKSLKLPPEKGNWWNIFGKGSSSTPSQQAASTENKAGKVRPGKSWLWLSLLGLAAVALIASGGSNSDNGGGVTPPPASDTALAYPENDGDIRFEFAKPANWSVIGRFEIWRDVLGDARGTTARGKTRSTRAFSFVSATNRDDATLNGTTVALYDTNAGYGYLYAYRIVVVNTDNSKTNIAVYNGQAPAMQLAGVGPYVPPPTEHVVAVPAVSSNGQTTLYWYIPGEAVVQPPTGGYPMPSYVTGFTVQIEDSTGAWTTVASGLNKNLRQFTVQIPQPDLPFHFTVRAVSSQSGLMYPLDALSATQQAQAIATAQSSVAYSPTAPTGVQVAAVIDGANPDKVNLRLNWTASTDQLTTGYNIYRMIGTLASSRSLSATPRSTSSNTIFSASRSSRAALPLVGSVTGRTTTTWTDTNVDPSQSYVYFVASTAYAGAESLDPASGALTVSPVAPSQAPTITTVPRTSNPKLASFLLQWSMPSDPAVYGYIVMRSAGAAGFSRKATGIVGDHSKLPPTAGGRSPSARGIRLRPGRTLDASYVQVGPAITQRTHTSYTDSNLTDGVTYSYAIEYLYLGNVAGPESPIVAQAYTTPPGDVTDLTLAQLTPSSVKLTWTAPTLKSDDSTPMNDGLAFWVYRSLTVAKLTTANPTVDPATLTSSFTKYATVNWNTGSIEYTDETVPANKNVTYAIVVVNTTNMKSPGDYEAVQLNGIVADSIDLKPDLIYAVPGSAAQQFTVTVKDTRALPMVDTSVTLSCTPDTAGSISATQTGTYGQSLTLVTNAQGIVSFYWKPDASAVSATDGVLTATVAGTSLSDQTVLTVQPAQPPGYLTPSNFSVDAVAGQERIYYSADADDQLADASRTSTPITITGLTNTGQPAPNAMIMLTTDRGGFTKIGTDQLVSTNGKIITGKLDANGQMVCNYIGRPDDGLVKSMHIPTAGELGQPAFVARDLYAGVDRTVNNGNFPRLIGPPYSMVVSMTPKTHPGWPVQTDLIPVTFQTDNNTVVATVTDLLGQQVLKEMPIWFTQHWSVWRGPSSTPYDYTGAFGSANFSGAYDGPVALTDENGAAQAGFSSNHSGTYKILVYALRKGYSTGALDAYNQSVGGGLPDPLPVGFQVLQYLLPTSGSAATPTTAVTGNLSVMNKTLAFGENWHVKSVSDGTITAAPPNLYIGGDTLNPVVKINCDGSQAAPITFWAEDEDGKKVLSGVPFKVAPVRWQAAAGQRIPAATGGLLQTTNDQSVVGQLLSFNNNSEATVKSRGDQPATIGLVTLQFDNLRDSGNLYQLPDPLLAHRGPSTGILVDSPANGAGIYIEPLAGETAGNVHVIAGSSDPVLPARNSVNIHLNLKDASNNTLPAGYHMVVSGYQSPPVTYQASGAGMLPVVSWTAPSLNGVNTAPNIIDNNPAPRDATNPNRNLRIMLYGNSWETPREDWIDQYLIVERPNTLTGMASSAPGYGPQSFNQNFTVTVFANDNRVLGAQPVFDGFPVKFGLTKQYGGDATITPMVRTATIPGIGAGAAQATFNTGTKPDVLTIFAYYDKNNNDQWDAGEIRDGSGDIRVGTPATVGAIDLQPDAVSGYQDDLPKALSVTVRDNNAVPLPNQLVNLTLAPVNAGGLSAQQLGTYQQTISVTTDAAGQASFYWKPGSDVVAAGTITATMFGTALSDVTNLQVLERPPADYKTADSFDVQVAANNPSRIYYSDDEDDQLSSSSVRRTDLRITGHTSTGAVAALARVTISTDRGGFEKLTTDQIVSLDKKQISGILDASGQMLVRYTGRPDNGIVGMVLPASTELGQPIIKGQDYYVKVDKTATGNLPYLIGPPHEMRLSINPIAHAGWPSQTGLLPVTFQIDTNSVRAEVTDLIGQRVLAEMPVWFSQHWTKWQNLTPYDYNGVQGHASISGAYYGPVSLTDPNGIAQAGFASNHSGVYKILAFALRRNFNVTALDSYNLDNVNGGLPDPLPDNAPFLQYLLPATGTDATPATVVSSNVSVLNKTMAYYNNWQVLEVSDGNTVATTFAASPTDVPPIIINCDGSEQARILFTAQDEDGKKVLPEVPFRVKPQRAKGPYGGFQDFGSLLQLDGDLPNVNRANTFLSFNDHSEAYVISRGDADAPGVGTIRLQFDNLRSVQPLYTYPGYLVGHRGPSLTEAMDSYTLSIGGKPQAEPARLASAEAVGSLPKSAVIDLTLMDENTNAFPNCYYMEVDTSNSFAIVALNGQGEGTYTYNAPALPPGNDIIDTGPTAPAYDMMRNLRVMVFGNPWEPLREDWYPQRVTVERPHTYPGFVGNFGQNYGFGAVVRFSTVVLNDMLTGAVPVLPGFQVKYGLSSRLANPSATITPSATTDQNGVISGIFNSGNTPDVVRLYAYYDINGNNLWDAGESGIETDNIYIGVMDVTGFRAIPASIQRNQLTLEWNPVPGATSYELERTVDNVIWEPTGLSGTLVAGKINATDTGLGAGVLYHYRVRGLIGGQFGNWVLCDARTVLDTPTGFATSLLTDTTATVTWLPVYAAETYTVQQLVGLNTWINVTTTLNTNTIALTNLIPNTTYTYRVRAVAATTYPNASDWSANWVLTTLLPVPTGLGSTLQTQTSITLDWADAPGATSYDIERSPDGTNWSVPLSVPTSDYFDNGTTFVPLVANTTYFYRVRAVNATNLSNWTANLSIKTLP